MTPADFKRLRKAHGMTQTEWGRFLGYTGKNIRRQIMRYENDEREIPAKIILRLQKIAADDDGFDGGTR